MIEQKDAAQREHVRDSLRSATSIRRPLILVVIGEVPVGLRGANLIWNDPNDPRAAVTMLNQSMKASRLWRNNPKVEMYGRKLIDSHWRKASLCQQNRLPATAMES